MLHFESPIYALVTDLKCWRCGQNASVIGIGSCKVHEDDGPALSEDSSDLVMCSRIRRMPERLLQAIRATHPLFAYAESRSAHHEYFANHCSCGAMLGDHYVFSTPDQGFLVNEEGDMARITCHTLEVAGEFEIDADYSNSSLYGLLRLRCDDAAGIKFCKSRQSIATGRRRLPK